MTQGVVGAGYRFERSIRDEPLLKTGRGVVEQVEQGIGRVGRPGILPDARSLQRDADRDVPDIQGQHHHAIRRARGDGGDWPIRERVGSPLPVSELFSSLFEHPLTHDVAGHDERRVVGDVVAAVCRLQVIEGDAGEGHAVAACVLAAPRTSPQRLCNLPSEPIFGVRRVTLQLVEDDGGRFFEVLIRKAGILEQTRHQVDRAVYVLRWDHQEVGHYFTGCETVGRRVEPAGCSPKRVRVALVRAEQDVLVQVREPPLGRLLGERPVPHGDQHGRERDGVVLGNDDVEPVVERGSMDNAGERRLLRARGRGEAGQRQNERLQPSSSNARRHVHARDPAASSDDGPFAKWSARGAAARVRLRNNSGQQPQTRRRSSQPATAANSRYEPNAVTAAVRSLDGGGPKNTNAWTASITRPNTGMPYRPRRVVAVVDRRYRNIPPNSTATSSRNAGAG